MRNYFLGSFAFIALFSSQAAFATDNVTSPYVDKGKLSAEWKGGYTFDDDSDSKDGAWKQKLNAEYGAFERVSFKAEGTVEQAGDSDDTDFSTLALQAKWQITPKDEYWVDAGVRVGYEFNLLEDGADSVELKVLLNKNMGKFAHRANITFEREVGGDSEDGTNGAVSWSSRYKYNDKFQPGFEIYSDFGDLSESSDFDEQKHKAGPVFYGALGPVKYDVGYLFGVSDEAADGTLKAILKYDIPIHK